MTFEISTGNGYTKKVGSFTMNYDQDTEEFLKTIQQHQRELDAYDNDLWLKMAMYLTWGKLDLYIEEDTLLLGLWIEE